MAWKGSQPLVDGSRVCGSVSLATKQYHFVKLHTDGTLLICAADTDRPYGILQNNPAVGEEAVVCIIGISKLIAGEDIDSPGGYIGTGADGRGEVLVEGTDITKYLVATTIENGTADGDTATVVCNCAVPQTASAIV